MRFTIDDIDVFFPYDYIYPEQYNYMVELKHILDAKGHGLLEMPSGTGKTIALLSFIIAYQQKHPDRPKLVYCSRTVPEIDKALVELKRLMLYRERESGAPLPHFLGLGLSSRRNLCINDTVASEKLGKIVDAKCHDLTASWVRQRAQLHPGDAIPLCPFFERLDGALAARQPLLPAGVYTLDDVKQLGRERGWCPYFLLRHLLPAASVIIYSYYYLLDPKVAEMVSKELPSNCIVVFDEAHNIDNVCIESLSIDLSRFNLEAGSRSLQRLSNRIDE